MSLLFCIALGQRLEKLDIEDGELCVIDTELSPEVGDVVLCEIPGMDGAQLKRLGWAKEDGTLFRVDDEGFGENYSYAASAVRGVLLKTYIPNVKTDALKRSNEIGTIPTVMDEREFMTRAAKKILEGENTNDGD